jgi:H+/Cl- antiporter ClcA
MEIILKLIITLIKYVGGIIGVGVFFAGCAYLTGIIVSDRNAWDMLRSNEKNARFIMIYLVIAVLVFLAIVFFIKQMGYVIGEPS